MTHISQMTRHARRPLLILLAAWRAIGEDHTKVASENDLNTELKLLGEESATPGDLYELIRREWIFDVDYDGAVQLRPKGIMVAKEVSDEVVDPIPKARNLRVTLLRWIWEQTDNSGREAVRPDDIRKEQLAYFGTLYTQDEVGKAAAVLEEKGWITGPGIGRGQGPIKAKLTPAGRAEVEGDAETTPAVSQIVTHNYHQSNVAHGSSDFTQTMDNRVSNAEGVKDVLHLVRQWQQNLAPENRIEELEEAISSVEEAVQEGAQKSTTTKALGRLKDVIQDSTSGAVGQAGGAGLVFAITGLLQTLGWA
jgi:hypothetical protein